MEAVIRSELQARTGRALLALQNHIYGCFLFMEDIAQQTVTLEGLHVQPYGWHLDTQFWEIGMRYGFIMDAGLNTECTKCTESYKAAWLAWFQEVAAKKSIREVDAMEDRLIRLLRETVPAEEAFFVHALESGELPMVWKEKAVRMLVGLVERVGEPVKQAKPLEPAALVSPSEPAPQAKPSEPLEPASPSEPAKHPEPLEPVSPSEPAQQAKHPEPLETVKHPEPAKPVETSKDTSKAPIEQKPMAPKNLLEKHRDNPKRMFACTRRQRMVQGRKTILSTTRRQCR